MGVDYDGLISGEEVGDVGILNLHFIRVTGLRLRKHPKFTAKDSKMNAKFHASLTIKESQDPFVRGDSESRKSLGNLRCPITKVERSVVKL